MSEQPEPRRLGGCLVRYDEDGEPYVDSAEFEATAEAHNARIRKAVPKVEEAAWWPPSLGLRPPQ